MKKINPYLIKFIPAPYFKNEETLSKARLFVLICFITALVDCYYLLISLYYNMPHVFIGMACNTFIFPLLPFLLKYNKLPLNWLGNLYVGIGLVGMVSSALMTGGLESSLLPCLLLLPMNSILLVNKQSGFFWTLASFFTIILIGSLANWGISFHNETDHSFKHVFVAGNLIVLGLTLFLIALVFENTKNDALNNLTKENRQLAEEKKRTDDLLLNFLPLHIVTDIKQNSHAKARHVENVTILFIQLFNVSHHNIEPTIEQLQDMDTYIKSFNNIIERNGLEKINTSGDSYVAVCGLSNNNQPHALQTIQAAKEIIAFTETHHNQNGAFNVRVGIHSGPCIAGIVDVNKISYDVWGETINTASFIEKNSEAGRINISGNTYQWIKDKLTCTYRGKIKIKGTQEIDMYFVEP